MTWERRAGGAWLLVALVVWGVPHHAWAHAEPYSWVDVRLAPGTWDGQVTAHVVDLAHEIGLATPDSLRHAAFVERHLEALHAAVGRLLHLELDGALLQPHWTRFAIVPQRQAIAFGFDSGGAKPPHRLLLRGPVFAYDLAHETYFNVYESGAVRHQDLLDHGHTASTYTTGFQQGRLEVIRRFVAEGVHHIFVGPDHILFIVGLLLLGGSLRRLLKIVTAFTVAHSVTLVLAATGWVTPPSRLVEPAIALSIIYIGVDNLLRGGARSDRRALIAAGFGLVHGFGFASVLRELGLPREALAWSLFSFNVGVEIGQMCIVLAVAPFLAFLRSQRPMLALRTVTAGSFVVVAAGAYWFVQRAFLS